MLSSDRQYLNWVESSDILLVFKNHLWVWGKCPSHPSTSTFPEGWNCVPDPIMRPAYFVCCFWWWWWFSLEVVSDSWGPVDCNLQGSSVYGISQARMLEWVAISFSRGSSQPRIWTWVTCFAGRFITGWATRKTCTQFKIFFKLTLIFSLIYELFGSMSFSFQTLVHSKTSSCY